MDPVVIAFAVAVPAAFAAGVVFHKYVISEAAAIKQHVSEAEDRIRGDVGLLEHGVASALTKVGSDVAKAASKL